jgi:hypothetical protein
MIFFNLLQSKIEDTLIYKKIVFKMTMNSFWRGEEPPDTHRIGGWVGPGVCLKDTENLKLFLH